MEQFYCSGKWRSEKARVEKFYVIWQLADFEIIVEENNKDFFESDRQFVLTLSTYLLVGGLIVLLVSLIGRFLLPAVFDGNFLPVFGGFQVFRKELTMFNLPMAMMILGIGLRLFTFFGWLTCVVISTILSIGFGYLAFLLYTSLETLIGRANQSSFSFEEYPVIEAISIDVMLALIFAVFLLYMILPSTRKLYFQPLN
ncbi:MAG: hypothetical protein AAFY71_11655 [Bacteroidota bacterium]